MIIMQRNPAVARHEPYVGSVGAVVGLLAGTAVGNTSESVSRCGRQIVLCGH